MNAAEFVHWLDRLGETDLRDVAAGIRSEVDTADGEVTWWRATVAISAALRHQRCTRDAGMYAHEAGAAVLAAAERCGMLSSDHDATTIVARAASEVARGLVAGPSVQPEVEALLAPFRRAAPLAA